MVFRDFYIQLGRLFYSIAMSDGQIQKSELQSFQKILQDELVPLEDSEDPYGTDTAYYAEFELERLIDEQADKNEAFTSFIMFMEENSSAFDEKIKKLSYQSAARIAKAHAGIEPAESKLLCELKRKLDDQG